VYRIMATEVHEPVNLGNPDERPILEIAQHILAACGKPTSRMVFRPLPVDDPRQRQPDISKAVTLTGWRPRIDLGEGLAQTIAWFRQQPTLNQASGTPRVSRTSS